MKNSISILIVSIGLLACVNPAGKMKPSNEKVKEETDQEQEKVEVTIEKLTGTWQLKEVRVEPFVKGSEPKGGIFLMGITSDYKLAFAADGQEELIRNLDFIPSDFTIKDNQICAADPEDFTFTAMMQRHCLPFYLLNENELIFGKGKDPSNPDLPLVFHYYQRLD